jgi:hypothetical protein
MKNNIDKGWNRPGRHSSDYGLSIRHNHDKRSYAGIGPKGYRRSDRSIKEEASETLFWSPDVDASELELDVQDGCIFLKGFVDSRHAKKLAQELIESLSGVNDVQNQLIIKRNLDLEEDKIIARGENGLFSQEIIQK